MEREREEKEKKKKTETYSDDEDEKVHFQPSNWQILFTLKEIFLFPYLILIRKKEHKPEITIF